MYSRFLQFLFLTSMSLSVSAAEKLNSTEIIQTFSGNTSACIKEKDQSTCSTYMGEQGQVKRHMHDSGKQRLGKWHAAGHQLCIMWQGKSKDLCFDIVKLENGHVQLIRKGKLKSTVTGFQYGDHSGF